MQFCTQCGKENIDSAKFCNGCGKPMTEVKTSTKVSSASATPKFASKTKASGIVNEFFEQIIKIEAKVDVPEESSHIKKLLVLLGFVAVMIAAIILLHEFEVIWEEEEVLVAVIAAFVLTGIFTFILFAGPKTLFSQSDMQKKNYIENFPVPNNKEDMIDFLIHASSQIILTLGITNAARKQRAWNNIWNIKCRQIFAKADILFTGDSQSQETIKRIKKNINRAVNAARNRILIPIVSAVFLAVIIMSVSFLYNQGVFVTVPNMITIPPENVRIVGILDGHFIAADGGVTMTTSAGGTAVNIRIEVESLSDIDSIIEKEATNLAHLRSWVWDYCIFDLIPYQTESSVFYGNGRDFSFDITPFLRMRKGDIQLITLRNNLSFNVKTVRERKIILRQLMASDNVELNLSSGSSFYGFRIEYRPPNADSATAYFQVP